MLASTLDAAAPCLRPSAAVQQRTPPAGALLLSPARLALPQAVPLHGPRLAGTPACSPTHQTPRPHPLHTSHHACQVNLTVSCTLAKDVLRGDDVSELRLRLLSASPETYPFKDDD